ncbi:putative membrane protein [Massilia aurea]|uniref:Putative membrane protein n=1 Tax=Massilia aurea TaxID=373040 RepID=A0A7W9WYA1_9BURK|nr:DUF1700 domain-containing protein [Massilia aurea]MBB6133043.1 putative membrane protein [Massilia aurea]
MAYFFSKLDYLDALKRALMGLPPDVQAKTLAWYEQRFVDGAAVGRSEQDVAKELGDPRDVALTLRTNAHFAQLSHKPAPTSSVARTVVSGFGLLVFNLFMLIPAAVFASLLMALYVSAFGVYVSGIAVTASGLAGSNELVLSAPLSRLEITNDDSPSETQTRVSIGEHGIQVYEEPVLRSDQRTEAGDSGSAADSENRQQRSRVLRGAEAVAERRIQITTDLDPDSRTTQVVLGCGLILGGIALFLLSLVFSKYTIAGIRRYVNMNMSLLKG